MRATIASLVFAGVTCVAVAAFAAGCMLWPAKISPALQTYATLLGDRQGKAGAFMLRTVPLAAPPVAALAAASALLIGLHRRHRGATAGLVSGWILAALVAGDVVVHASGINPVIDLNRLAPPAWLALTTADADSRFYVGGKIGGTLNSMDFDASRGFEEIPGLTGSGSRAALSVQAAFYPSPWGGRELLSYDLPVLWPQLFFQTTKRFVEATRQERDLFLDRMAVRYRVLPQRRAGNRVPLMKVPQFYESFLFDFGDASGSRASVVPSVQVMHDAEAQIKKLFAPGWDSRQVALIERDIPSSGAMGEPVLPRAGIVFDGSDRTVVEAGAGANGGYLVLLDSYSDDWHATVDGQPAQMARADGLFRAVHLTPGRHSVEFSYRPRALWIGTAVSTAALICVCLLLVDPRRRRDTAVDQTAGRSRAA